ncbi:MAG: benzoate transporter [Actinobacteria bacterium]|nr:MAG: benzoate transporter [Actinomycetota bacterium]
MRRIFTMVAVAALALAACTADGRTPGTTIIAQPKPGVSAQLVQFGQCDELLDWIVGNAVDLVGPYGFESWDGWWGWPGAMRAEGDAAEDTGGSGATPPVTSTNLQEAGVDEPDLVKTDGERIVVVSGQRLHLLTIDGGDLTLVGSVDLPIWSEHLFLVGDKVTVVAGQWGEVFPMPVEERAPGDIAPYPMQPTTTVVEVDIADLSAPKVTRTLEMDGRYVSARLVAGAVRLVISSGPTGFAWVYPEGGGLRAEQEAEQANRQLVLDSTLDNWLPYSVLTDAADRVIADGTLVECSRVSHPEEFSGLTALSLVTLTPEGLDVEDATSVFADGEIVYSTPDAAYVATTAWTNWAIADDADTSEVTTEIHRFALGARSADYTGSGEVDGYMLSQWSMSEYQGHLRVATTSAPTWWGDTGSSESKVTVLRVDGDGLVRVGSIGGLGKGEQIYAVRFIESTGYVVTFRQVDPLYVIDLSDPTAPVAAGELKIPGYSAYLHPIAAGILLGVGQDADEEGRTLGTQVSLFDVTDPAAPQRIDNHMVEEAYSEVEYDHHAFLFDAAHGVAVVPVQRWWLEESKEGVQGGAAIVLSVTGSEISELGVLEHGQVDNWTPSIRRSLVIGDVLVTVSDSGIMASNIGDLAALETITW